MTGTGTQADPYIPTTLTEFITAVGTSGAYVALDRDIYAAEDPAYTGVLTSTIVFRAVEVDGTGHALRGVTIDAANAFQTSMFILLHDLDIIDLAHKKSSSEGKTFLCDTNYYWRIRNCKISCAIDTNTAADFSRHISFIRSSLNVKYIGSAGIGRALFYISTFEECTVVVKNAAFSYLVNIHQEGAFVRSAFIFDTCRFSDGVRLFYSCSTPRYYCYFAFVNTETPLIYCGDTSSGSIVALDLQDATVNLSSGWTRATLAQMRDEAWLASVGFLP